MKNITMHTEGNILTLTIDLSKEYGPSSTGKTLIVASTEGNSLCNGMSVGVNVYKKNPAYVKA